MVSGYGWVKKKKIVLVLGARALCTRAVLRWYCAE